MSPNLAPQAAQDLVGYLVAIGHPRTDSAIKATAACLTKWCHGCTLHGVTYTPLQQAHALVEEAAETWDGWPDKGGLKALRDLFHAKFQPDNRPERQSFDLGEKPPIACRMCQDLGTVKGESGYRYCDCAQGKSMAAASQFGDRWLILLNRKNITPPLRIPGKPEDDTVSLEEAFRRHREWLQKAIADAKAVIADPEATRERKEIAREELKTYQPTMKQKRRKA